MYIQVQRTLSVVRFHSGWTDLPNWIDGIANSGVVGISACGKLTTKTLERKSVGSSDFYNKGSCSTHPLRNMNEDMGLLERSLQRSFV